MITQLEKITRLDQVQRFERQHVSGEDEEGRDSEMATTQEWSDPWESSEVVISFISEPSLENCRLSASLMCFKLVMMNIDKKGRKPSQSVTVLSLALPQPLDKVVQETQEFTGRVIHLTKLEALAAQQHHAIVQYDSTDQVEASPGKAMRPVR